MYQLYASLFERVFLSSLLLMKQKHNYICVFFSDNSVFTTCSLSAELPETAEEPSVVVHCTSDESECWVGACIYYTDGSRFFGCTVSKLERPLAWTKTDLSSTDLQNGNTTLKYF